MVNVKSVLDGAMDSGRGILHLAPNWVPRTLGIPGARIGLARTDLYAYGVKRGGIDERWLASTTQPANGPAMGDKEGLSELVDADGNRVTLLEAIEEDGDEIIGAGMMKKWGRWPTLGKLFDNVGPLPFHLHPRSEHAKLVGEVHKPEAYYFPPQYNQIGHSFPHTYFGLEPGTTKDDVRRCLENWGNGDNNVLDLSKAYRIEVGSGWMMPPGVLHAPASAVTYEIQWGTDTFSMFQSIVDGWEVPWELVVKDVPKEKQNDIDFILSLIDWDANVLPNFKQTYVRPPKTISGGPGQDHHDRWIIYGNSLGEDVFSAKELTLQPGAELTLTENGPCGILVVQGHGEIGPHTAAVENYIRFDQLTADEFFVTDQARNGYRVKNTGPGPMVILRHFGPRSQ
jgi:hypothetical protein